MRVRLGEIALPPPALARCAAALALVCSSSRLCASDGFDAVLAVCPDDRVACVSSLDPAHFLEPWELDGAPSPDSLRAVADAASETGASCAPSGASERGWGLACEWANDRGSFWVPTDDAVVHFRAEDITGARWDGSRNKMRLEKMRMRLGYAKVPVVRNRRALASEREPDGGYRLKEERPWKQAAGERRFYGEDGQMPDEDLSPLRMLFPFERLGPRGSPAQSLLEDSAGLAQIERLGRE
ncbi:hypothetical protein KFE25_012063 [Diacronema lutheri]|uniref:Uncharacterized protein n=1 Tax=Diacronema lutheri TaxID=2081491 RepID=A0A7R9V0J0_DIALT|nr:hypothetical protein KFE25_012063 [Diacronema lutheri]|mmetsp:Transcript_9108/g.28644  ORF Transcript_9108/g.28644 Transcript_9108/m.28644 type:complete len:241 (+) Transcript_9108:1-723(+)